MTTEAPKQGWHVANWGTWGWAETIVKLIGAAIGVIAFFQASGDDYSLGSGLDTIAIIDFGLILLSAFALPPIRILQREVISIIYAILNLIGHLALMGALLREPSMSLLPFLFGLAYVAGELVKQRFLVVSGYTEQGQTTAAMLKFSRVVMVIYLVFAILVML